MHVRDSLFFLITKYHSSSTDIKKKINRKSMLEVIPAIHRKPIVVIFIPGYVYNI